MSLEVNKEITRKEGGNGKTKQERKEWKMERRQEMKVGNKQERRKGRREEGKNNKHKMLH